MKKIAVIGASYLQLPLIKKIKELGIEAHCFAWEEGAVCKEVADFFYPISVTNKERILEVCQRIQIDGIISIASDITVPTVCYVAEYMGLISNVYEEALVATNKYLMRQRFSKFGVSSPHYVIDNENYTIEDFHFPLIVKPTDRSGSLGVKKIEHKEDLIIAVEHAKKESFTNHAIIEEYISGPEVSVESISWQGMHYILAITDKVTTGEPFFVEIEHHQPSQLDDELQEKIKTETIKVLTALNINNGASHSEFKITDKGEVFTVEVGSRMGGDFIGSHLVQLSTGYDFLKGIIDISLGKFEEPVLNKNKYSGVYFLSEETRQVLSFIQNAGKYSEIAEAEITDMQLHPLQCSADRSGYFIYQSDYKFII